LHYGVYGGFVCGVELAGVDVCGWVESVEFAFVCVEMGGREVAEVDGAGAVAGELVCGCAADANFGVCTFA
jgi:hypothetical protein